ncbi:hypothetical protein ABEF89_12180 [Acinetobacter thermotolerans]|uniref:hypothetical protein n=1 Tax=Acinetobacter thermotolerans TaxID=3151487 RepID=UPI00325C1F7B
MSFLNCSYDSANFEYTLIYEERGFIFKSLFRLSFPDDFLYRPVQVYDGFLFAVVSKSMRSGEDLYTDLPISAWGLRQANLLIEAWNNLNPSEYAKIQIFASKVCEDLIVSEKNEAISAFSGGVDACFTLVRHNENDWNNASYNIKNVLCVHGFDIKADAYNEYEKLMTRVSPILDYYECKRLNVWTNITETLEQDWEMTHSAQLACCLHLFSEHFTTALLGSSDPYNEFDIRWGSNPAIDFLFSSDRMKLVHDGAGFTRTQKVHRISTNPEILKSLKVCWINSAGDNCGICEKCYRTRLNFLASDIINPSCFNGNIKLSRLLYLKIDNKSSISELKSILNYAKKRKMKHSWVSVLNIVILKSIIWVNLNLFRKKIKNAIKKPFIKKI